MPLAVDARWTKAYWQDDRNRTGSVSHPIRTDRKARQTPPCRQSRLRQEPQPATLNITNALRSSPEAYVIEATGNAAAVAAVVRSYAKKVVIANRKQVRVIAHAKIKIDAIDAGVLTRLYAWLSCIE